MERFLALLMQYGIAAVCDVRSSPYSRMNPQFNRETLKASLEAARISYVYLGRELGARSENPACYVKGRVSYELLAATPLFRSGLERVRQGAGKFRIALMCAEKEPLNCHRSILVSRRLEAEGLEVRHILADGTIEPHSHVVERLREKFGLPECDFFRSPDEVDADAYRMQGERMAFEATEALEKKLP